MPEWIKFLPKGLERGGKAIIRDVALANDTEASRTMLEEAPPRTRAAGLLLCDLLDHGWNARERNRTIEIHRSDTVIDGDARTHVRQQHVRRRDDQLRTGATRKFVQAMETRRLGRTGFTSIFSLMRDGRELGRLLRDLRDLPHEEQCEEFACAIRPYLQFVDSSTRCEHTGLRLLDIWRYFRHTWSNHYGSVPGRSLMVLVRDAAAPFHPVIGIAALGSSVVQSAVRDQWIGWAPDDIVTSLSEKCTLADARWIAGLLRESLAGIYTEDFLVDVITPSELKDPTDETIARLDRLAGVARDRHKRSADPSTHKGSQVRDDEYWMTMARTDLFISKRAALLALLLRSVRALGSAFVRAPSAKALKRALSTSEGRRHVTSLVRRRKAEAVGVSIADITVCGAVPPYSHLLGGKLVAMLLASPQVVHAYRQRYQDQDSVIASSLAGHAIKRPTHLVCLCTTSLYGVVPNQYTRVSVRRLIDSRNVIRYKRLGNTAGYGSFHISDITREALAPFTNGVKYIFGEGVSPRMRLLREGVDALGLPSDDVLLHGSSKVMYGVALAGNVLEFLLGRHNKPDYLIGAKGPREARAVTASIGRSWVERWLSKRVMRDDVIKRVEAETLVYPIRHGARVSLPPHDDNGQLLLPIFSQK